MSSFVRRAARSILILPAAAWASTPINLVQGWNLVGNSDTASIDVAARFTGTPIATVWKWNKVDGRWAFYTPGMSATELAAYAASKQYDVLSTIESKQGFWVNANAAVTVSDPLTTPPAVGSVTLTATDLSLNWNLLASGDNKTPSQLNAGLASSMNAANKSISTVWAWDSASSRWRFYAPSLESLGQLATYTATKGYLPFTAALAASDGFWVNVSTATANATASDLVAGFLAAYDASFATAVPSTGATISASLDGCYLNGGLTKAMNIADFNKNLPTSIEWNRYRIGAKRTLLQILADRTSTNADGSSRREIDVVYKIDYADGTVDSYDKETLISGSSVGSVMADGSVCTTPDTGTNLRFFGDRHKVYFGLRPGNERAQHFRLDTGLPWSQPVGYSKFVQFRVQDPSGIAQYAVVTGPGLPPAGIKLLSPRIQRDNPLMAGKKGHYINKDDGDSFSMCRVDATTGNVDAAAADCVAMGASGTNFGNYDYASASELDKGFDSHGFVAGGKYTVAVYNDDGWQGVNGQANKTPVVTYTKTLGSLPYSAVALAGSDVDHDLYPRMSSTMTPVDIAAHVRSKTAFTTDLSWTTLGTLPDAGKFGWGGVYFYESGPVTAAKWPKTDQEWDVYPAASATSITGLSIPAPANAQMTPTWGEGGVFLDNRNGARIWSIITFD